jgi:hypothetical protein
MIGAKQYGGVYIESKSAIPPIKKRQPKKKPTPEERLLELEKWREDVREELDSIRNVRFELAEFVFQTVAIIVAIFALIITVFLAFSTKVEMEQGIKLNIMVGSLGIIAFVLVLWLVLWCIMVFRKRR